MVEIKRDVAIATYGDELDLHDELLDIVYFDAGGLNSSIQQYHEWRAKKLGELFAGGEKEPVIFETSPLIRGEGIENFLSPGQTAILAASAESGVDVNGLISSVMASWKWARWEAVPWWVDYERESNIPACRGILLETGQQESVVGLLYRPYVQDPLDKIVIYQNGHELLGQDNFPWDLLDNDIPDNVELVDVKVERGGVIFRAAYEAATDEPNIEEQDEGESQVGIRGVRFILTKQGKFNCETFDVSDFLLDPPSGVTGEELELLEKRLSDNSLEFRAFVNFLRPLFWLHADRPRDLPTQDGFDPSI